MEANQPMTKVELPNIRLSPRVKKAGFVFFGVISALTLVTGCLTLADALHAYITQPTLPYSGPFVYPSGYMSMGISPEKLHRMAISGAFSVLMGLCGVAIAYRHPRKRANVAIGEGEV